MRGDLWGEQFCLLKRKYRHYPALEFLDIELHFWLVLQFATDADKAAAIFFDDIDQVKAFDNKLVAQAGAIVVGLYLYHSEATIEDAGAENGELVVKYLDLDVVGVGVAAVHDSVKQRLLHSRQRVGYQPSCLRFAFGHSAA